MGWIDLAEQTAAATSTPGASRDALYVDSADAALKVKNSAANSRTADNTVYRTLAEFPFTIPSGITTGVVVPGTNGIKSGADVAATFILPLFSYTAADYGTGAKFRLKCRLATNAVGPGTITYTFGLYSVTFAGATTTFIPTTGTVVTGSTAAIVNPAASSSTDAASTDWAVGAANFTDGLAYVAGINLSATSAGITKGHALLQTRNT